MIATELPVLKTILILQTHWKLHILYLSVTFALANTDTYRQLLKSSSKNSTETHALSSRFSKNALWVKEGPGIKRCKELAKLNLLFSSIKINNYICCTFFSCLCPFLSQKKNEWLRFRNFDQNYSTSKQLKGHLGSPVSDEKVCVTKTGLWITKKCLSVTEKSSQKVFCHQPSWALI